MYTTVKLRPIGTDFEVTVVHLQVWELGASLLVGRE